MKSSRDTLVTRHLPRVSHTGIIRMAHNTKKITRTERECEGDRVCDLDGKRTTILRSHILAIII